MMDVLYYYYYWFYSKIAKEDSPFLAAVWVLSFDLTWLIGIPIHLLIIYFTGYFIANRWSFIGLFGVIFYLLHRHYVKTPRWKKLTEQKPVIFNSHKLSATFAIIFTVCAIAFMYIGVFWGKKLLDMR